MQGKNKAELDRDGTHVQRQTESDKSVFKFYDHVHYHGEHLNLPDERINKGVIFFWAISLLLLFTALGLVIWGGM